MRNLSKKKECICSMTPGNKIRRGESKYCTGFMDTNRMWFLHVDLCRLTCALEVYLYYGSIKVNFFLYSL